MNQLTGLPATVGQMVNLAALWVADHTLVVYCGKCQKGGQLLMLEGDAFARRDLSNNALSSLPAETETLVNLQYLCGHGIIVV